jgi:hypothetical protein
LGADPGLGGALSTAPPSPHSSAQPPQVNAFLRRSTRRLSAAHSSSPRSSPWWRWPAFPRPTQPPCWLC